MSNISHVPLKVPDDAYGSSWNGNLEVATKNALYDKMEDISTDWGQNGFENRTDSTISFTDGSREFSIQPTATNYSYWIDGTKYTATGDTVVLTDAGGGTSADGVHAIYYDGSTLTALANPTASNIQNCILTKALVSIIIWDASNTKAIYVGEERHGYTMSPSTHNYLHWIEGCRYGTGLGLNTMSVDGSGATADAQFGVDSGTIYDEDLHITVSAVNSTTGLPIYYMDGSNWRQHIEAGFSARTYDGTDSTRLAYNQYTGGSWQLTEVSSGDFVLYHVFATTEKDNPMVAIMGQAIYTTKRKARKGADTEINSLLLDDLIFPEARAIATIIFQTRTSYASTINARVVSTDDGDDYVDWRNKNVSRTQLSTTDHSSLSNLGADDHTQYILADGTRDMTGYALLKGSKVEIDDTSTYLDKDGSGNMTFTDAVTGTRTLKTIGCPVYHYIKATGQSEGDLHLSDATNWAINKALIKYIRVVTSSTDWDLYLLQNDNGYATDDATIPKLQIMEARNGNAYIYLDHAYEDEDASSEVHLYYLDNSGTNTATIIIGGTELI